MSLVSPMHHQVQNAIGYNKGKARQAQKPSDALFTARPRNTVTVQGHDADRKDFSKMIDPENKSVFEDLGLALHAEDPTVRKEGDDPTSVNVNKFMMLFIAQIKYQNPLEPEKASDSASQLAQFSQVEKLETINKSINHMVENMKSAKLIRASKLIGKLVDVPSNVMHLVTATDSDGTQVTNNNQVKIKLPDTPKGEIIPETRITVKRLQDGKIISQETVPHKLGGSVFAYDWNGYDKETKLRITEKGLDAKEKPISDGEYLIEVYSLIHDKWEKAETYMPDKIESVNVANKGVIQVNSSRHGSVDFEEVDKIYKGE